MTSNTMRMGVAVLALSLVATPALAERPGSNSSAAVAARPAEGTELGTHEAAAQQSAFAAVSSQRRQKNRCEKFEVVLVFGGVTFFEALEEVADRGDGAVLASITSHEEQLCVASVLRDWRFIPGHFWLAGSDHEAFSTEGEWRWIGKKRGGLFFRENGDSGSEDDTYHGYTNWADGEPNGDPNSASDDEDCMSILTGNLYDLGFYTWNDKVCDSDDDNRGYVIRRR
jgi:hypothetical protein